MPGHPIAGAAGSRAVTADGAAADVHERAPAGRRGAQAGRGRLALGEQPAHVALAWLLHQEGVTGPIIGPRTEDQLDDAQHAITVHLGEDVLKRLDDIFPGYQPAPEHYAW